MNLRIAALLAACGLSLFVAVFVGPSLHGPEASFVIWQLRVPRVMVGALVGATLSLVGAVFQALFQNPLATSDTVGTTAGATVGALVALGLPGASGAYGVSLVTGCAFVGALGTGALVASFAASRKAHSSDVLLAGIAVTLATSAVASGVQYVSDSRALFAATQWSLGQLPQVGYRGVFWLGPPCAVSCASLLSLRRSLTTFALGPDLAHSQGVNVPRLRWLALSASALGVAACVAWCGPIAFVGLVVPRLVRWLVGPLYRRSLPLSLCVGAAVLVICDAFARTLVPGRELPVGIVTAALGAPALVWLVARAEH